jgi:hypothetical protein
MIESIADIAAIEHGRLTPRPVAHTVRAGSQATKAGVPTSTTKRRPTFCAQRITGQIG